MADPQQIDLDAWMKDLGPSSSTWIFRNGREEIYNERLQRRFMSLENITVLVEALISDLRSDEGETSSGTQKLEDVSSTIEQLTRYYSSDRSCGNSEIPLEYQRFRLDQMRAVLAGVRAAAHGLYSAYLSPMFREIVIWGTIGKKDVCMVCMDRYWLLELPCNQKHQVCKDCAFRWYQTAMSSGMSQLPPRCCGIDVPLKLLDPFVPKEFLAAVHNKIKEREAHAPIVCRQCSWFLACATELDDGQRTVHCDRCSSNTCVKCRELAHDDKECAEDVGLSLLLELSKTVGWANCPKCPRIIERSDGCNHMICPCGIEFCYACGKLYKDERGTCVCPLFPNELVRREYEREQRRRYEREDQEREYQRRYEHERRMREEYQRQYQRERQEREHRRQYEDAAQQAEAHARREQYVRDLAVMEDYRRDQATQTGQVARLQIDPRLRGEPREEGEVDENGEDLFPLETHPLAEGFRDERDGQDGHRIRRGVGDPGTQNEDVGPRALL